MDIKEIYQSVADYLRLDPVSVEAVDEMLCDGATIPFIARYRKERTRGLDEVAIRAIQETMQTAREIENRREFVIKAISDAGAMTDELYHELSEAGSLTRIEDLYAPFRPKRRTRATRAREKGLEPLARMIMGANLEDCLKVASRFVDHDNVADTDEALGGASDIIAEWASDSMRLRGMTRHAYNRTAFLTAITAKGRDEDLARSEMRQYTGYAQPLGRVRSHQYLALRRAENEGLIHLRFDLGPEEERLELAMVDAFTPEEATPACRAIIGLAVVDASRRLLRPSVENEILSSLKAEADRVAIDVFTDNLRQLLLAAPLKGRRVLAMDPGYRSGCKVVALDSQGNLLEDTVIYPVPPRSDFQGACETLSGLMQRHSLEVVALGNGTASRETERFLHQSGLVAPENLYVVSENGASVYSASDIARREFPDKDVTVRGAVSIGRRLIDPLAELVKIDPKSIGVGQYQHDVDQTRLKEALDYTVMSCVNSVGVDVNTASEQLLSYVSGISSSLAANIVAYRTKNGPFTSREALRGVPRLGSKAFQLAAGFLRVPDSVEPLDNTAVHPESYALVAEMAHSVNATPHELAGNPELLDSIDIAWLADHGVGGYDTMADILVELRKPGRDPRTDDGTNRFIPEIDSFDQLYEGQIIHGVVNNITAFGAFVDVGLKENGLIHISQLAPRRISSVSEIVHIGQIVEARVIGLDPQRGRISLSLLL